MYFRPASYSDTFVLKERGVGTGVEVSPRVNVSSGRPTSPGPALGPSPSPDTVRPTSASTPRVEDLTERTWRSVEDGGSTGVTAASTTSHGVFSPTTPSRVFPTSRPTRIVSLRIGRGSGSRSGSRVHVLDHRCPLYRHPGTGLGLGMGGRSDYEGPWLQGDERGWGKGRSRGQSRTPRVTGTPTSGTWGPGSDGVEVTGNGKVGGFDGVSFRLKVPGWDRGWKRERSRVMILLTSLRLYINDSGTLCGPGTDPRDVREGGT